jgi:hypothetical protein
MRNTSDRLPAGSSGGRVGKEETKRKVTFDESHDLRMFNGFVDKFVRPATTIIDS